VLSGSPRTFRTSTSLDRITTLENAEPSGAAVYGSTWAGAVEDVSAGVWADVLLEPPPEAQPNSETTPKINEANSPAEIFWVITPPK
jgi:hypothetical protein